jgi:hypothetical protein
MIFEWVVVVLVLMVAITIILYFWSYLDTLTPKVTPLTNIDEIHFENRASHDCIETQIPCITDQQCRDNCRSNRLNNMLRCNEGFCSNVPSEEVQENDIECDQNLGMIRAFLANEFFVTQFCISTYRDIIDDQENLRPYVCDNGSLNLDLMNNQFTVLSCQCRNGYTRYAFSQGLSRIIPVCIPNSLSNLYNAVYTAV